MHPPRMSAPSCIVPPLEQLIIRPHIIPLLPNFHGMESENPYAHIKEFEEDKAKIWLNSLRPRSIRNWVDLQAEFLKKFFPTHRTNGLKRQISNFSAKENEKFYECWERYMEAINACPHHGFDTWLLVSYFYDGMSSSMKQILETMCGGDFMKMGRMKAPVNPKSGMYMLSEDMDMKAKVATMARRLEELELKKMHEVQAIFRDTSPCHAMHHLPIMKVSLSTKPKSKGVHEVETQDGESSKLREVKAVITLRSGKEVDQPLPKVRQDEELMSKRTLVKESNNQEEKSGKKSASKSSIEEEPRIDLCTVKRGLHVTKKAFLTEQVSAIIQSKSPVKYKDPGCPTISVNIGGTHVEKALLDLGASVNLLS
ncbi:hypothetical protein CK203_094538 [Vitis vinifera]|uniref:Retrotransposon gag domain-containing protein n=1 Tax=Vitis vinifera TaxID=29760 RepID=A0A438D4H3_VITVI|nr:hypothetical protein CK203_094538 [Vitis vinifera]